MPLLDLLRGVSLLGIAALNAPAVLRLQLRPDHPLDVAVARWSELLLRGHFFPIFSLLFGVSFGLVMASARRQGLRATPVFLRRLAILAGLGALHQLVQPGEVLLPYAVFGLLLLPFERAPLPALLGASALICGVAVWTSAVLLTPGLFLLGLALQRLDLFRRPARPGPVLRWLAPALTAVAVGLTFWQGAVPEVTLARWLPLGGYVADPVTVTGLAGAAAIVTGLWWLSLGWTGVPRSLRGVACLGRMSLTTYLMQTAVFAVIGWCGGRGSALWLALPASLLAWAVTGLFSAWWLARHRRGPLEYLWTWGSTLRRPA